MYKITANSCHLTANLSTKLYKLLFYFCILVSIIHISIIFSSHNYFLLYFTVILCTVLSCSILFCSAMFLMHPPKESDKLFFILFLFLVHSPKESDPRHRYQLVQKIGEGTVYFIYFLSLLFTSRTLFLLLFYIFYHVYFYILRLRDTLLYVIHFSHNEIKKWF